MAADVETRAHNFARIMTPDDIARAAALKIDGGGAKVEARVIIPALDFAPGAPGVHLSPKAEK